MKSMLNSTSKPMTKLEKKLVFISYKRSLSHFFVFVNLLQCIYSVFKIHLKSFNCVATILILPLSQKKKFLFSH